MAHKYTCDMCTHTCCIHLDFHGNTFASPFFHTRKKRPPGESQVQSCGTRSRIINEGGEPHSKFDKWEGFFGWHLPFYTFLKQKQTSKKSTFPKGVRIERFRKMTCQLCVGCPDNRALLFYSEGIRCCLMTPLPGKKPTLGGS